MRANKKCQKTKFSIIDQTRNNQAEVEFKYLGSIPTNHGRNEKQMRRQLMMARSARAERIKLVGSEPFFDTAKCTYKEVFLEKEEFKKDKLWWYLPNILRNFETGRSKRSLDLSENNLNLLTGFHGGHCRLTKHLLRIRRV